MLHELRSEWPAREAVNADLQLRQEVHEGAGCELRVPTQLGRRVVQWLGPRLPPTEPLQMFRVPPEEPNLRQDYGVLRTTHQRVGIRLSYVLAMKVPRSRSIL